MPNAVTALDDVSFEVEEGRFRGHHRSHRLRQSTLITHMNGLNKPTSGKIIIDGRDLWAEPEKIRDFRFLTGLVFQYPSTSSLRKRAIRTSPWPEEYGPRRGGGR